MKQVLIRADGSSHLGMGHIFRGLAIAGGFRSRGIEPLFMLRSYRDGSAGGLIRSRGYDAEEIPSAAGMEAEVQATRSLMADRGIRVIVTDVCHREAISGLDELRDYHERLKQGHFLIVIGGSFLTDLPADILVSPYFRTEYRDESGTGAGRQLIGPDYFIFTREFTEAARVSPRLEREARHVLVTVGGGDPFHLTSRIMSAMGDLPDRDLETRVIVGPAFSGRLRNDVQGIAAAARNNRIELRENPDMAEAMLWADLAITGDGLTKYETAVTGTPSIMMSTPESEVAINVAFAEAGTTLYLGDGTLLEQKELADTILKVLIDYRQRRTMSRNGRSLVDGRGLDRILQAIPSGAFK